ncbi:MAG: cytochrome c family protein [Desulfovibrionaceae bacterium]
MGLPAASAATKQQAYVGSAACGQCHEAEYTTFQKQSKKAKSWIHVAMMAPKLTPEELRECYACHTTGYNKGGFVDYNTSPHLADVGCETCHGAGAAHAENGDPSLIQRKPSAETCQSCHAKRIRSFKRAPLMYSGAH